MNNFDHISQGNIYNLFPEFFWSNVDTFDRGKVKMLKQIGELGDVSGINPIPIGTFSMHFRTSLSGSSVIYARPFSMWFKRQLRFIIKIEFHSYKPCHICASFVHGVKRTPEIDISVSSAFLISTLILQCLWIYHWMYTKWK